MHNLWLSNQLMVILLGTLLKSIPFPRAHIPEIFLTLPELTFLAFGGILFVISFATKLLTKTKN
jgi:hypothetical protein